MTTLQRLVIAFGAAVGLVLVSGRKANAEELGLLDRANPGSAGWIPPPAASPYRALVDRAELREGIPNMLFLSLLMQESAFLPEIINGGPNPQGAVGIAQIVKRWHPASNPTDPIHSINYASALLKRHRIRFGTWDKALAAYNWGPTVLAREGYQRRPLETREYVRRINARVYA